MVIRHFPRERRICLAVIASAIALAACGGGGGPPPVQGASPGGIWRGTDSATGLAITGLVEETGSSEFMRADGAVFEGQVSTSSSNSLSLDAQGYPSSPFSHHGVWTVSGTIQERKSISATTQLATDAGTSTQGTLDLTFDALYDRPSSLATVAGGYMDPTVTELIGIEADGSISGHVVTLGNYSGQISVIDPTYNLYRLQLTFAADNGGGYTVSGLAAMDNTVSPPRLMLIGVATGSGSWSGTFSWVDTWCTPGC